MVKKNRPNPPFITIVIPNFNEKNILEKCLRSIFNQTYTNFQVIVVDNGSIDNSTGMVKKYFPQTKILNFNKNNGFSVSVNKGIKEAEGKYIFLLNNDTTLDSRCLENIFKYISKTQNKKTGSFQVKMVNAKNHKLIDSAGVYLDNLFFAHQIGLNNSASYSYPYKIWGVCAGAAVYKKKMLEDIKINGEYFDEDFFAFYEDTDINFRARLKGWNSRLINDSIAYHIGGGTKIKLNKKIFFLTRNRCLTALKNIPFKILIEQLKYGSYFDNRSWNYYKSKKRYDILFSIIYGYFGILPYIIRILKKRYFILLNTKVTNSKIKTWFLKIN